MAVTARHLLISGKVQGVFFRESMRREAERLGVTGWVRNLPDGRVEAVVAGPGPAVHELVAWCGHGPSGAAVKAVSESPEPIQPWELGFRVVR